MMKEKKVCKLCILLTSVGACLLSLIASLMFAIQFNKDMLEEETEEGNLFFFDDWKD